MKAKARPSGPVKPDFPSVFSEIPWEDFTERMAFSGKIKKGEQTAARSITLQAKELRIAEIIKEAAPHNFQTISDVIRDAVSKGLQVDYEILVRRNKKVKHRADATFNELVMVDDELALISHIEMVEKRITNVLQECKKNIAGKNMAWGWDIIDHLTETAENDFPNRGVKEHFDNMLHRMQNTPDAMLYNMKEYKRSNT
jgi:hypothetical protein